MTLNAGRYITLFHEVVDLKMPRPSVNFREEDMTSFDLIMEQRKFNMQMSQQIKAQRGLTKPGAESDPSQRIPPELERSYQIVLVPGEFSKKNIIKMRDLKSSSIGGLVSVKGIVTRASDVKPCMHVAVYTCGSCGFEVY